VTAVTGARPARPVAAGATLRLLGPGPVPHPDPLCCTGPAAAQLARLSTRTLFGYPTDPDPRSWRPVTPVADLAEVVPSMYNAGSGASHRSYVITLRRGVYWDTPTPREVTVHDVVRGLKRLGNPVVRHPLLPLLTSTIRGLAEFCAGYAAATAADPSAERLAGYQREHEVAGLLVLDDDTVVLELTRPAVDVIELLALPCTAPAPQEYDEFVPGSPGLRTAVRSTGPYRPVIGPEGGHRWEPNPAWQPDTDPLRTRQLAGVRLDLLADLPSQDTGPDDVDLGGTAALGVAARLRSGEADLAWNVPGGDPAAADSKPWPVTGLDPYLAVQHPDQAVRRALAALVDRDRIAALAARLEPGLPARPATTLLPDAQAEPVPGPAVADPTVLAGIRLTVAHSGTELAAWVARSCAENWRTAGAQVVVTGPGRPGPVADVVVDARWPEAGPQLPRVLLQPLAQPPGRRPDPELDRLVTAALAAAADERVAVAAWHSVAERLLRTAAVVPLLHRTPTRQPVGSARVLDAVPVPTAGGTVDLTGVRLAEDR
jgi:peptide/nickel transport system substrate-binding protein